MLCACKGKTSCGTLSCRRLLICGVIATATDDKKKQKNEKQKADYLVAFLIESTVTLVSPLF